MISSRLAWSASALLAAAGSRHALAQDSDTPAEPPSQAGSPPAAPSAPSASEPKGILPLLDYSGAFSDRRYATGDWGGKRPELAAKGLSFELDWTQTAQGVVSGGRRIDWDYGGSLDFVVNADLQQMGLMPGALLKLRVESRYGESVNDDSGGILPVNTDMFFPLTDRVNQGIPAAITELTYLQYLSKTFGFVLGKIQTLDGDPNEFASGRGRSQFMNSNLVFNGAGALTVPYSTLGAGLLWAPHSSILITSSLINTTDSSTTSGFDHVEDGWSWASEAQFQYKLGSLPGGANAGGVYAFAGDFAQLGGKLQLIPGAGLQLPRESDSWYVYASLWQYLYTPDEAPARINQADGRPDLRGIGLFARFGFADEDTNPIKWTASIGIGGRGMIPGRDEDTFGLGYVFTELENLRASVALGIEDSTQAIEAYYNIAVTPSLNVTLDVQWIDGGSTAIDEAVVLGARANLRF
jgi:porin